MNYRFVIGFLLLFVSTLPAAAARGQAYTIELLVDGRPLEEYRAGGRTYVEAREDREYSIRLKNGTAERVAIALAVDGLNTIDARHTDAVEARKWILGPYETITLDGWQVSSRDARRFYFTSEARSYGAWLGQTSNLGLITAAIFREKSRPIAREPRRYTERQESARKESRLHDEAPRAPEAESLAPTDSAPSDDYAATGIGRKLEHRVRQVAFEAEAQPAAVLELRYEYRDALVRLGVLPERYSRQSPLSRREHAQGFHGPEFAPDPFD